MKLTATGYNTSGEAIAIYEEKVFYVPGLIVGETADCKIIMEKEKWGRAKITRITEYSINRRKDLPKNHLEIGGYEILHMDRVEQTRFKNNKIKEAFKSNAKVEIDLDEMFIGENQFRYRNKITLHDGGFHKRGTNEVIELDDFLLTDIKPKTKMKGNVIIRKLNTTISGNRTDKKFTSDTMCGTKFIVGLNAFYQVNKEVTEAAYFKMMKYLDNNMTVFDLYSGIGTITLTAAKKSKHVYGVERNGASFASAILNQENNDVENVTFIKTDVVKFLAKTKVKPDVVMVDPAREGLGKEVCQSLNNLLPKRIIYLSCNPGTQAADYFRLKENYNVSYTKPYDMFPQTHHVENLIILDRK